jgi:rhodanese-related sulfurtransferase
MVTRALVQTSPPGSFGIDEMLRTARNRLTRLGPAAVARAMQRGAVLVDIRPVVQRAQHGEIPGAIVIERNVLEWRLDPRSDARLSFADSYDLEVIVTCQEGYTSSLAAASLLDLGLHRATDLEGGFAAWRAAGLPHHSPRSWSCGCLYTALHPICANHNSKIGEEDVVRC